MAELQTDQIEVNVDLAKRYFEDKKRTFYSDYNCGKCSSDGFNEVHVAEHLYTIHDSKLDEVTNVVDKLFNLANEIEANADLFAQIEYLVRGIPIETVKRRDLQLITQSLRCPVNIDRTDFGEGTFPYPLFMNGSKPLAELGLVTVFLFEHVSVCIIAEPKTAAVCSLFADLCKGVGLNNITLLIYSDDSIHNKLEASAVKQKYTGNCVGVITSHADVDSAVDILLESPDMDEGNGKLVKILVQEAVYDAFKRAASWKSRKYNSEDSDLKRSCSDYMVYKKKKLLLDFVGRDAEGITVEAYRTNKELLAILNESPPRYLSLWTNDISEANEISYQDMSSPIIWINEIAVFNGCIAQAFYKMDSMGDVLETPSRDIIEWLNRSPRERFEIIANIPGLINKYKNLSWVGSGSDRVNVDANQMGVVRYLRSDKIRFTVEPFVGIHPLKELIDGNALLIDAVTNRGDVLYRELIKIVPSLKHKGKNYLNYAKFIPEVKVVYSHHGTIFAN